MGTHPVGESLSRLMKPSLPTIRNKMEIESPEQSPEKKKRKTEESPAKPEH